MDTATANGLGTYMRHRRAKLGFTQEAVARRMDVSTRQLMKWEAGEAKPSIENLAKWLDALGVAYTDIQHILLGQTGTLLFS